MSDRPSADDALSDAVHRGVSAVMPIPRPNRDLAVAAIIGDGAHAEQL
jgi:hypothetical protein